MVRNRKELLNSKSEIASGSASLMMRLFNIEKMTTKTEEMTPETKPKVILLGKSLAINAIAGTMMMPTATSYHFIRCRVIKGSKIAD